MRRLILLLFFLLFTAFSNRSVLAADLNVTCDSSGCTTIPGGQAALFNETKFLPGQDVTRTIYVVNNSSDDCSLKMTINNSREDEVGLDGVVFTAINDGFSDIYGVSAGSEALSNKNFANLFNDGTINFGGVPKSSSKTYSWVATFNPLAGNEFQGLKTKFDFNIYFTCESSSPGTTSTGGSTTLQACSEPTPGAPSGLNAVLGASPGQVNLSWTAPTTPPSYTYFLVAYSDSSSWPPKWGNPNVGSGTSYTVSGLGSGSYWFWVRAGNGCQPGPYVGPVTVGISGAPEVVGPAEGFSPGVLGEATPSAQATASAEVREVKGAATCVCIWWPILLLGTLAQILYLVFGKLLHRRSWIIPSIVALVTFAVFWYLNRNCVWVIWQCRWFWLLDLIVLLITLGIAKKFLREN
jgi:hypothetical protein